MPTCYDSSPSHETTHEPVVTVSDGRYLIDGGSTVDGIARYGRDAVSAAIRGYRGKDRPYNGGAVVVVR